MLQISLFPREISAQLGATAAAALVGRRAGGGPETFRHEGGPVPAGQVLERDTHAGSPFQHPLVLTLARISAVAFKVLA